MAIDILLILLGIALAWLTLRDVFDTVVVPGGARGSLQVTRRVGTLLLYVWKAVRGRRRGITFSFAPLVLVSSFVIWMSLLSLAFGLMKRGFEDYSARGPRHRAELMAACRWADGSSAAVLVANVSYQGCEIRSNRAFEQGETIWLALPGRGKIKAQVRWVRERSAGVKFLTGESAKDERRARLGV